MSQVKERSKFRGYENFDDEQNRQEIIRMTCSCNGGGCHCFERLLELINTFKEKENRILTPVYVEFKIDETTAEEVEILHGINVIIGDGE